MGQGKNLSISCSWVIGDYEVKAGEEDGLADPVFVEVSGHSKILHVLVYSEHLDREPGPLQ